MKLVYSFSNIFPHHNEFTICIDNEKYITRCIDPRATNSLPTANILLKSKNNAPVYTSIEPADESLGRCCFATGKPKNKTAARFSGPRTKCERLSGGAKQMRNARSVNERQCIFIYIHVAQRNP